MKHLDKIGMKYGKLTVLDVVRKPYPTKSQSNRMELFFVCKCDCGNKKEAKCYDVLKGKIKSCGCLAKEIPEKYKNKVGMKFNKLTVLDVVRRHTSTKNNRDTTALYFVCRCDCGQKKEIMAIEVLRGKTKACGCLQRDNDDLTDKTFGKLTAIKKADDLKNNRTSWLCYCECGNKIIVSAKSLKSGNTKSCGCLHRESITTHGVSDTRLYKIYQSMKQRCSNPKNTTYKSYGERGIKVYKEWNDDFTTFRDWALNNGYKDNLTLDRIDVNGNYEPSNCRWATMEEQSRNKRNNILISDGECTKTITDWANMNNISPLALKSWIMKGFDLKKAIELSKDNKRNKILYNGDYFYITEIAELNNINYTSLRKKIKAGLTTEEAVKQCKNNKKKKYLYNEEYLSLEKIAKVNNINPTTFRLRIERGLSIEEAINYNDPKKGKHLYNGEYLSLREIAKLNNIKYETFYYRIKKGMTIEEALSYKR